MYGRRKTFRCPVQSDRNKAILRAGRRDVEVFLEDESSGGFSVSAAANLAAKKRQLVKLRTEAGWCEARVMYRVRQGNETRLGLQRVRELPNEPDPSFWTSPLFSRLVAAGLLLGVIGVTFLLRTDGFASTLLKRVTEQTPAAERSSADELREAERTAASAWERELVAKMNGIMRLTSNDTTKALRLSVEQRDRIRKILQDGSQKLAEVYRQSRETKPVEWCEESRAAAESVEADSLAVLTPDQQTRWQSLAGE